MSQSFNIKDRSAQHNPDDSPPPNFIEIQEDHFGDNICMTQLIGVAKYMKMSNIYKIPTQDFDQVELPAWMKSVVSPLEKNVHRNVKLFLLNFIFKASNDDDIFSPFAVHLYKPVLRCLVEGDGVCVDGKLNYMCHNLITIMLHWSIFTGKQLFFY